MPAYSHTCDLLNCQDVAMEGVGAIHGCFVYTIPDSLAQVKETGSLCGLLNLHEHVSGAHLALVSHMMLPLVSATAQICPGMPGIGQLFNFHYTYIQSFQGF